MRAYLQMGVIIDEPDTQLIGFVVMVWKIQVIPQLSRRPPPCYQQDTQRPGQKDPFSFL